MPVLMEMGGSMSCPRSSEHPRMGSQLCFLTMPAGARHPPHTLSLDSRAAGQCQPPLTTTWGLWARLGQTLSAGCA